MLTSYYNKGLKCCNKQRYGKLLILIRLMANYYSEPATSYHLQECIVDVKGGAYNLGTETEECVHCA